MGYRLLHGDCLEVLRSLPDASVDAVVTDPPYHLTSIVKRFGKSGSEPVSDEAGVFARKAKGFMGQEWDGGDIAFRPELWAEVLRVVKPGAHLASFGGTRTYHRMACAIEDAGHEIRDSLHWLYGSGFPKSLDASKELDRLAGVEREVVGSKRVTCGTGENFGKAVGTGHKGTSVPVTVPATEAAALWSGWGTAIKPAHEPIVLARAPLSESSIARQVLATGTGALNIDACRVPAGPGYAEKCASVVGLGSRGEGRVYSAHNAKRTDSSHPAGRWPTNLLLSHGVTEDGYDACENGCPEGCPVRELEAQAAGASEFFPVFRYEAKPSRAEREAGLEDLDEGLLHRVNPGGLENDPRWAPRKRRNIHPTVKPKAIMRWLVRLVTPPGGVVLDLFAGSGTTLVAAILEGFDCIGIERSPRPDHPDDPDYLSIARARCEHALKVRAEETKPVSEKAREEIEEQLPGQLTLFGDGAP